VFPLKTPGRRSVRDVAEKPFWISFSDLMTALMVLFLVAMTVTLVRVSPEITGKATHETKVNACIASIEAMTQRSFPGVRARDGQIDFGTVAQFNSGLDTLDQQSINVIRSYVPRVLAIAKAKECESVFKRVTVTGYASRTRTSTYIFNLDLSLRRAQRLLCVLLDPAGSPLTPAMRDDVRELFLVAGSSFNQQLDNARSSQRIELKLEFLAYGEKALPPYSGRGNAANDRFLSCPLDRVN
jgi:outer membrane protein OmpA-like peptidoglycan-associated protein